MLKNSVSSLALLLSGACACAHAAEQRLVVSIESYGSDSAEEFGPSTRPAVFPLWYAFHDGTLDTFDLGDTASPMLAALALEGLVAPLVHATRAEHPGAVVNFLANNYGGPDSGLEPTNYRARSQAVDPATQGFFSFAGNLAPSDDAFVGNDDPHRFRVFDAEGNFLGPLVIDIYGSDVLDAGARRNLETNVQYVVSRLPDLQSGQRTSDPIAAHPGYNGSLSNPDGAPVGILGVAGSVCSVAPQSIGCFRIDALDGDFSRNIRRIARIRITESSSPALSGFWYQPALSGEGYALNVSGFPPTLSVGSYTYRPDDSGRQMYLVGAAAMDGASAQVDLYETQGGRFGSPTNPQNVQIQAWGTLNLTFLSCDEAALSVYPLSDEYVGFGDDMLIFLQRSTPLNAAAASSCYSPAVRVGQTDDSWPTTSDVIEPQG